MKSMTSDNRTRYLQTLLQYYEEEIQGEGLFARLAHTADDSSAQMKWQLLQRLEHFTQNAMRPLIERNKLIPKSRQELLNEGAKEADDEWLSQTWEASMKTIVRTFPLYCEEFLALWRMAPLEDRECCAQLLEHEMVLIDFAYMELIDKSNSSLDLVNTHIRKWQPK